MPHLPTTDVEGRIETLFDGVRRLRLPTPYRVGDTNAYIFAGDGSFDIIDPGPALEENIALLNAALAPYGLDARDARTIVLTHGHEDHGGLAAALCRGSRATVLVGRGDIPILETNMREAFRAHRADVMERFRRLGFRGDLLARVPGHFESRDYYRSSPDPGRVAALDGGERLELGTAAIRAIRAPGHTRGSICYWLEEKEALFPGDTLVGHLTPNPGALLYYDILFEDDFTFDSLKNFLGSLEGLRGLGARTAFPGHGEPVEDVRALVDDYLAHHRKRIGKVLAGVRERERTCLEIAEIVFGETRRFDDLVLQAMEVLAHLIYLEATGEVVRRDSGGGPVLYGPGTA